MTHQEKIQLYDPFQYDNWAAYLFKLRWVEVMRILKEENKGYC